MLAGSTPALSTDSTCCGTQTGKAANFKRSCLRVRLPPAVLRFKQPSGGTGRHATLRMSCPHAACEFNSRLGYFFSMRTTMRVSQAHPGLISLDRRVRPPNPLLRCDNNADGPVPSQVSYARHVGCDPRIRYFRWSSTQTGKAASMRGL